MFRKSKKLISCLLALTLVYTVFSLPASASFSTNDYQVSELVEGKMYVIQNGRQTACYIDTNGHYTDGSPVYAKKMDSYNATNSTGQTIYGLRKIWYPDKISSTVYGLRSSYAPGKGLYVPDVGAAPFYINLTTYSGNTYQQWKPAYLGSGYFNMATVRNYNGGSRYMDLYDGSSTSSRLEAYAYSSSNSALKWRFYPAYKLGESVITYGTSAADGSYNTGWTVGECTWYCLGRSVEKTGTLPTFSGSTNHAKYWYANVNNLSKGQTIQANSIAVFGGGDYGHVVFVEYIENGFVYYTEANNLAPISDGTFNVTNDGVLKRIPTSSFATMYNSSTYGNLTLTGYIYLP